MQMTRKLALLAYNKCRPETCEDGICAAAQACPSKLLKQAAYFSSLEITVLYNRQNPIFYPLSLLPKVSTYC